jgi:hypothetical protein
VIVSHAGESTKSPQPPDPWQSLPSTPEDEVYEPDPDDADTGPLQVPTPRPDNDWDSGHDRDHPPARESYAASYFDTPLVVNPRSVQRDRKPMVVRAIVVLAIVVVGALVFWLLRPSPDTPNTASTNPITTTAPASPSPDAEPADPVARGRLLSLLPPGYAADACKPAALPRGALAKLSCEKNSDPGGPLSSTYTLVRDKAALGGTFDASVGASKVVNCPGNIQSPGPWRRNATPQQTSGTLVCAFQQGVPSVAWTTDADLLVSSVQGDPGGPNLDELYAWWSTHS